MSLLCLLVLTSLQAQHQRSNTFGGFGFGFVTPQTDFKNGYASGFQISGEVNGRLYRPLWLYLSVNYENFTADNTVVINPTSDPSPNLTAIGGGLGLKIFPVKFLYINAGGGIKGLVSGTVLNSDKSTAYFDFGAGLYIAKFLGVFVNYTSWQLRTDNPSYNYLTAGAKISFGRR